jgi:hypothetical protein
MKIMKFTSLIAVVLSLLTGCYSTGKNASNSPGDGMKNSTPPQEVIDIIRPLLAGKGKDFVLLRSQIPADKLPVLDGYASATLGKNCTVNSYEGCNSCCADDISSSICHTTCGNFCDKVCGGEHCY